MEKKEEEQIRALMPRIPELQNLYEEHVHLEKELDRFNQKPHLSTEEELEKKRIQKVKLAGKDRMMEILHEYQAAENGEKAG